MQLDRTCSYCTYFWGMMEWGITFSMMTYIYKKYPQKVGNFWGEIKLICFSSGLEIALLFFKIEICVDEKIYTLFVKWSIGILLCYLQDVIADDFKI